MKQLSMFLYRTLRFLSRWFLRVLYPGMMVEGVEYAYTEGPLVLAGNHPNTLVDPLIQGIHFKRRIHFMANAGLFANPTMGKFLRFAGVIPIARRGVDGEAGRKVDNNKSFDEAHRHFEQGGVMFVAPEGGSELERRLRRPLKTGTARMALAVEADNDWKLGLKILPAGGNYEAPTRCFSRAFVRFGEPMNVADWRAAYEESPRNAAKDLTEKIGEAMAALLIDTQDKKEERCLRPIERAVQNDQPLSVADHHYRTQRLLAGLRTLDEKEYDKLCQQAENYEKLTQRAGVSDAVLSSHPSKKGPLAVWLGLPFFLYGALNHALLLLIVELAWKNIKTYRNYAGTVRGLLGCFVLPITYALQSWIASLFIGSWAWLYLLTLPVFGFLALAYYTTYGAFWAALFGKKKATKEMVVLRMRLTRMAEKLLGTD